MGILGFTVITTLPSWLFIFCLLIGAFLTIILYYKNKNNNFSKKYLFLLSILRFLYTTLIAFLLMAPLFKTTYKRLEKPIIIFAQDNSASVIANKDSTYYKEKYKKEILNLKEKFSSDYNFQFFNFSDKILTNDTINYSGKQTDISQMLSDLMTIYANRNVGALILATDGIYNKGLNPLYAAEKFPFPIYTIALGDTTIYKDIIVSRVNYNRIAYLGNNFPIEIIVTAYKCKGINTNVKIYHNKELLFSKSIVPLSNNYSENITAMLEAKETGVQRYRIVVEQVEGEKTTQNNVQEIYVKVLDSRSKILILGATPHPDIAAIKQAIDNNFNYEAETYILDDFNKPVENYSVIILHQIPWIKNSALQIIEKINKASIPVLYILGPQTNLLAFNNLKAGLTINVSSGGYNESVPFLDSKFALFTIDEQTKRLFSELPPLICHFGNYKIMNSATVMLYQKIGKIVTDQPLILFNELPGLRNGVITGTGIWRWRIMNYAKLNNHNAFNELINKILQYLSVKDDRSNFRLICKNNYLENESIIFNAEVYNDAFELVNEPDVELVITNSENKSFNFVLGKTSNTYFLNAGFFPAGEYNYMGKVKVGDKIYSAKGGFTVSKLNVEYINTVADHSLLYNLANRHNGKMLYPSEMLNIYDIIKSKEEIKTISYIEKKYSDVINLFWVLVIIIILMSSEWFIRKFMGSY